MASNIIIYTQDEYPPYTFVKITSQNMILNILKRILKMLNIEMK